MKLESKAKEPKVNLADPYNSLRDSILAFVAGVEQSNGSEGPTRESMIEHVLSAMSKWDAFLEFNAAIGYTVQRIAKQKLAPETVGMLVKAFQVFSRLEKKYRNPVLSNLRYFFAASEFCEPSVKSNAA